VHKRKKAAILCRDLRNFALRTFTPPNRSTAPAKLIPGQRSRTRTTSEADHKVPTIRARIKPQPERQQYGYTPVEPIARMETVDQGSRLERIRRSRPLCESLEERSYDVAPLEYLKILHSRKTQEYRIGDRAGKVFIDQEFSTLEYCWEAAVELERVFDMGQVLELRLTETMERVEDMVEWHYLKEWVALGLGFATDVPQ
jgi:hypothetical protein